MDKPLVVTRHPALIEYLKEQGVINGDVEIKSHVSPDDIKGRHVIGVLPLQLAALASKVTVVDLKVPQELRGQELDLAQIKQFAQGIKTYIIMEVSE